MTEDTRNLILAIGLSLLVIIGWNHFFAQPQMANVREAQTRSDTAPKLPDENGAAPALPAADTPAKAKLSRAEALATSARIKLDTPALAGSINLRGGRLDDVELKGYRETTDPKSANIVLLAPNDSPNPYFVSTGFIPKAGTTIKVPTPDSLWSADAQTLTAGKPVTLTFDNGEGLIFRRLIAVDDEFMFNHRNGREQICASRHPHALCQSRARG